METEMTKNVANGELIYNLMTGLYNLQAVQFPESAIVEDEFQEGKPCELLYGRMYDARERLCERLGVEEDEDIETIINSMEDIARILALKMYEYGTNWEQFTNGEKSD